MRYLLSFLVCVLWFNPVSAQLGDISETITYVGNPHAGQYLDETSCLYARNVWSMYLSSAAPGGDIIPAGYLYLGGGSYDPTNCGPNYATWLAVRPFFGCGDPVNNNCGFGVFTPALETQEITQFISLDGNLVIPGTQPYITAGVITIGEYYTSIGNFWTQHRNIPGGLHIFDMLAIGSPPTKLLVAMGNTYDPYGVMRSILQSSVDGNTWVDMTCDSVLCGVGRAYKFITFGTDIYAVARSVGNGTITLWKHQTGTNNWLGQVASVANMLPNNAFRIWANTPWLTGVVYLTGKNDLGISKAIGHFTGERLMYASAFGSAVTVTLPVAGVIPTDLRVIAGKVYLLSFYDEGSQIYTNYVHKSSDLSGDGNWTLVASFQTTPPGGIVRSFEHVPSNGIPGSSGNLIFGIGTLCYLTPNAGCDITKMSWAAGRIYKVAYTP